MDLANNEFYDIIYYKGITSVQRQILTEVISFRKDLDMSEKENLIGKRFGRLTVKEELENSELLCKCDCEGEIIVSKDDLLSKKVRNCGCYPTEKLEYSIPEYTKDRAFKVWKSIIERCYIPSHKNYRYYGGKGIRVCEEWLNDYFKFKEFLYSNGYDENAPFGQCTVDRIDNNKDYCPENCRIVPMKFQALNKYSNHFITYNGKQMTVTEAAELNGLTNSQVFNRLNKGWNMERALHQPLAVTKEYAVNGEIHTIKEWAQIMGSTYSTVSNRLKEQSIEEIYDEWKKNGETLGKAGDFSVKYEIVNGETHNRKYWANLIGINGATLRKLLKEHTMQEVYEDWESHGHRLTFIRSNKLEEANGEAHNRKEWAEILGISSKCLRNNLKKYTMQEVYDRFKGNNKV